MRSASDKKVIVHIVQKLAPGGIETLVLDLAKGSADTLIFSLDGKAADLIAAWPALATIAERVESFDAGAGLKPALVMTLARRLRVVGATTVFLHHVGPHIYGGLAAGLSGVQRIVHVEHDVWHYELPRRRMVAAFIETIVKPHHVAVSDHAACTLRALLRAPSVSVIPNGIDLERFQPRDKAAARATFGLDASWRIVGTAGRLVAVKGHDVLIRAMAQLPDDCHLVIAGSGERLGALQQCASDLAVASRVHFVGHVDAVESILPAFDVFCLPSHAEGFPRSVIEAQAVGLPVVATNVGALAEAVCPVSGRIVPPADPTALALAIAAALAAPPSGAPRAFVAERFSWQSTVASYNRVSELKDAA